MRFSLFLFAVTYLLMVCSCTPEDITPNVQAEGFSAILTEYTDQGAQVRKDTAIRVCSASGDYLDNLKSLYANKPNDTLRGFYNYKVMEYRFSAPYCN